MATFSNPDELLLSTTGKANFQRVTRLLITGGTTLLREVFDSRCRPSDLPKILSSPSTKKQLKAAKLTKPQWDCLYPSSGVYGKSTDFDITLLFKLVKIKCNLKPPAAGWEAPPSSADQSLAADLVRIKCYRNSVYAHVNRNMEITDDEFPSLWREISDILIRIAGQINHSKAREWQGAIDKFLKDPLTSQDERNVQELLTWYENDIDVKKNLEELKISVKSVHDEVQRRLSGVSERVEERAQFLETAVREESQNCKHQLGEELKTFVRESQKEVERLETSIQGRATESTYLLETAVREEAQGIKDKLGEELNTSTKEVQEEIERVQEKLEGTTNVLERLVRQESQEIKDQLREELRTLSKEVKDMKGRLGEEHQAANGNMASNSAGEMAIPLCLPNNYKWDSERGKCTKEGDERSYLYVVEEALEKLRIIKGPVCVVAIAGPYRNGKSYILSKALDQPPVFPLGHEMLPETVGIWMWILPEKHQDSNGQKYSVVLLDSEGTDSAMGEVKDDNQIFTLTVLLASVLIYNSERVPKRRDVEELKYIVNLSQRIHIKSNIGGEASFGDVNIFHEVFPFFIWLLRDVTLALPSDCVDIKEYFFKKVFPELKSAPEGREVVCSILNFFRGFDAFCLPPPSSDPAVLTTMSHDESQVEPAFVSDVERFKVLLKNLLAPKNSFNAEEFVSGEGLAHMVRSYVEAINTPGAIPNVENAWNVFVKTKCADAKEAAMRKYSAIMMSELKGRLPLDGGEIRKSHDAAFAECENEVIIETAGLSTNTVEDCLDEVKKFTDGTLESWHKQNAECTEEFCNDLIQQLERQHLDPLLQKLGTRHAAILSFQDIIDAYNQLKDDYYRCAIGAKDVIAAVFFKLNLRLQEKMKQGKAQLDILKDYDKRLAEETAARAYQAQETARLQEKLSRQRQDNNDCMKKMEHLLLKQKEENEKFCEQMKKNDTDHQEQIHNLKKANETALWNQQKENHENKQILNREILSLKKENEKNLREIKRLSAKANGNEVPSDGQGSFERTTTPRRAQPSFEKKKAPSDGQGLFESRRTHGAWHASSESTVESSDEKAYIERITTLPRAQPSFEKKKAPSDGQGLFESGSTQGAWHASSESTDESSDEEASFEITNSPSTQYGRIQRRTAAATGRIADIADTETTLHAVEESSFVDTILDVVAGGAAAVGAAVSIGVPALAPIVAPIAGAVSLGAMVLKKCSIM